MRLCQGKEPQNKKAPEAPVRKPMVEVMGFGGPVSAGDEDMEALRAITSIAEQQIELFQPPDDMLSTLMLPDKVGFSLKSLKDLMIELEIALWRTLYSPEQEATMRKILVDVGKGLVMVKKDANWGKHDRLVVAGTVTLTPSAHSMPLCAPRRSIAYSLGLGLGMFSSEHLFDAAFMTSFYHFWPFGPLALCPLPLPFAALAVATALALAA